MARRTRREINVFNLSFLDLISGALGAVIILYVAVPKATPDKEMIEELKTVASSKTQRVRELERELSTLNELKENLKSAYEENSQLRQKLTESTDLAQEKKEETNDLDVGFKFKGKNIVFIIDTSRSMLEEDRMGQVKAGLKMLLTSMPSGYSVDIIQFPNGMRTPFKSLYGKTQKLNSGTKSDIFNFLYKMKPLGATPTRDVVNYAFSTYKDMTDLVLLTDGEPSVHNSALKDDIYDLLTHIHKLNDGSRVKISTIGVGEEVLHDKSGKPYQFLKILAEQNEGFFVGF